MKDNYLYIIGDFQEIDNTKTNKVSILSLTDFSFVKFVEIGDTSDSLHQIVVNREANQIYATGATFTDIGEEANLMTDTVFIYDILTGSTQKIALFT